MSDFFLDPVLYTGRPASNAGRLPKELRCYDLLEQLHIPFQRADHSPADTIAECAAVEQVIGHGICKNLFLCNRQKTAFYLLVMPGEKPFRTKQLSHQIQSARLSFASAEALLQYLDLTPGSVSILGLMNDPDHRVQLLMDRDVAQAAYFRCHPCINTSSLVMRTSDLLDRFLPYTGHRPIFVNLTAEPDSGEPEKRSPEK
ncbi:prolyl-tRNA synthetase associated domain-containing protein [Yeguia hominis]|uniref:Prolyl-tRNA synthetase associated domain-containing protein n=1 Tax=Yeguia hominis TaxID=2763662 RepID=A0A926D8N4_9FIRM|nr:prolyl-tRNA synthetase associated domain-containing protein [Yeguia hominis]MBC8533364.1 prolyl-tRNA synthetase associated domain-containing protein [Yeguia hominis]